MTMTRLLLACSVLVSLGCAIRTEPSGTVVRESRSCGRDQHWEGRRCVNNYHRHDHDDHDHDRGH